MKKLFPVLAMIILASCSKSESKPPAMQAKSIVKFYSTNPVNSTRVISAKVDGSSYSRVNYSAGQPDCSAASFAAIELNPGNYTVEIVDPQSSTANRQVSIVVIAGVSSCQFFNLK